MGQSNRRQPPLLLVLTNIDRLRPFQEWSPPYDLRPATSPKAQSIVSVITAATADLRFDAGDVIPVSLNPSAPTYNIDALWSQIVAVLPDAKRSQLLRNIQDLKSDRRWSRLLSQTMNAGRIGRQTLFR